MTSSPLPTTLQPHSQAASAERMYDARASEYDASWHPEFAQRLVDLANMQPGERVLDIACGTGLATMAAAAAVGSTGHVLGIDVSGGMLAQARKSISSAGLAPIVDLLQHDVTCLSGDSQNSTRTEGPTALMGAEGTFDVVTCASALVLLDDPASALSQWTAFLRPGGRLVVDATTPNTLVAGMVMERMSIQLGHRVPWNRGWCVSPDAFKELLEGTGGLVVERTESTAQTGKGTRWFAVEDAADIFEVQVRSGPGLEWLERMIQIKGEGARDHAKSVFIQEWQKIAEDGKIRDDDLVWVAVARKTQRR